MAQENNELEQIQKDLEEAKTKSEEYLNGWKRERADFMNYKKEEMERIGGMLKYANDEIILKILPIIDNLYLAEAHIKDDGISQILKQFEDLEAIEEVEGETPEIVIEEAQKGYIMHGKLLRPAKVKISK